MNITQVIEHLTKIRDEHGELEVYDVQGNLATLGMLSVEELRWRPVDGFDTQTLPDKFLVIMGND